MSVVRILVIDDDPFILRMVGRMLADSNYVVTSARNGQEAIQCYRRSPYDLVITDVALPVSQGLETIRTLRNLDRFRPILAISGGGWLLDGSDLLDIARRAGATKTLAKPFTSEQLHHAICCCMPAA